MSSNTSIHSNAFNFMSFLLSQVDPRTGQYTSVISLPELKANDLCGPVVPLQLQFNALNNKDSGFGIGWNLPLSQFEPTSGMLSLYTGETFKVLLGGPRVEIPEKKLDSFHFSPDTHQNLPAYRVDHKSGLVEILQVQQGGLALPVEMRSPQGHRVSLEYAPFGTDPLLSRIANADGSLLLTLVRSNNTLVVKFHPGTLYEAQFVLNIVGGETKSLVLPTADQASWRFEYILKEGLTCLEEVWTPTGGYEKVIYSGTSHSFPGLSTRKLPRVETHLRDPGFDQAPVETRYAYDPSGANFVGYGSGVTWTDDGLDNLNKDGVLRTYQYETTETLWDALNGKAIRTIRRVFNRAHLLVEEETTQFTTDPQKDHTFHKTESIYYFDTDLDFADQQPYCQLPESVTETWHYLNATQPRHAETTSTTYDDFGNLLTQTNPDGTMETNEWYGKDEEKDADGNVLCPADPQGFVRNLKSKTITPAKSQYAAPTLKTSYRYSAELGLTGHGLWVALRDETLINTDDDSEQQHTAHHYITKPGDPFVHGRKVQEVVTLGGKATRTRYAYSKANNARNGETVLYTINTLTGHDGEKKVFTLEHSLLNGEPLINRDDNNVEIAYEYDLLSRVTKETVAPNTDYEASRTYTYTLSNAVNKQAMQTACDVKGVTTTTWTDGFNRVTTEARQDADAPGYDPNAAPRTIYKAIYNDREQLISETLIDWDGAKDVPLTSLFKYDDWGEQRSVIRPDNVEEHEATDPVRRTTTQWLEAKGMATGKTVTLTNLFDKPDSIKRYAAGDDPLTPGVKAYSEHFYHYDGIGRTAEEQDAAGSVTLYHYDAFDRMIKTRLPDYNEVDREYAVHSSEDLPVTISVAGEVLGRQEFDGLSRMTASITGGRRSEYSFDEGQTQPKSVLRPSGVKTDYVYRPELGEDPEQRIAVESTAVYIYDPQNARLHRTEEVDEDDVTHVMQREYFSTGELKCERRERTGEEPLVMHYEYSRQARLLSYVDVLEQTQTYEYNASAQLIETRLNDTQSTFVYDDFARLASIRTVDGAQSLVTSLEYDDFNREVKRTFDMGGGVVQTLDQTYDEVDRLTLRVLQQGSDVLREEAYLYDERGRLVDYTCTGSQCPVDPYGKTIKNQIFGFDAKDNMTLVETTFEGGVHLILFEYNNPDDPCQLTGLTNQLTPPRPGDPDYPDRIDFEYDDEGNLTTDELGRILTYDSLSRLICVSEVDGGATAKSYTYDTQDALSASITGAANERRFYQGDDVANLVRGADSSTFMRGAGTVLAEHQAGAVPKSLLLVSDDKNSVLSETSKGNRQDVSFSPYGYSSGGEGALGYNGELREPGVDRYLLGKGYRAYNPRLMRFESADSWAPFDVGGVNAYTYCEGDSINNTDKTGHAIFAKIAILMMAGDDLIGKGSKSAANAAGAVAGSSRGVARITDDLADLAVGARPSRSASKAPATGRGRTPSPDYSDSGPESAVTQLAGADTPAKRTKPKLSEADKQAKAERRELKTYERNREKDPKGAKEAYLRSRPGKVVGKDAYGHPLRTTNMLLEFDSTFGFPRYQVVVDTPIKQKRIREYQ